MKQYSDYTNLYVQDICDALNEAGVFMNQNTQQTFDPANFETLTTFLQEYVVIPIRINTFLNEKELVNRGRCPYTGERIDNSFPKWTYMNHRSIYTSLEGYTIMQKEDDENFEKTTGIPAPKRKAGGCYIATVCYGSELAPEVLTLKVYRDEILSKSFFGKTFIKAYYAVSPSLARQLQNKNRINNFLRKNILNKIVDKINKR